MSDRDQCRAVVYKLGPYCSGGIKRRYERRVEKHQCKRRAVVGCCCRQHAGFPNLMIWSPQMGKQYEFVRHGERVSDVVG